MDTEPEHQKDEQRRLILAIALSVFVYWVFATFVLEPVPPPQPVADDIATAPVQADDTKASTTPGAVASAPAAAPAPSAFSAPERTFDRDTNLIATTWSSFGGAPADLALQAYGAADTEAPWLPTWILDGVLAGFSFEPFRVARPDLGPHHMVEDSTGVLLPVALTSAEDLDADRLHYKVVSESGAAIAFSARRGDIEITKRYAPAADSYVMGYTVELKNVSAQPRTLQPRFGIADHVAESDGYYAPKRMTFASVDQDIEDEDPTDLLEDGASQWAGSVDWIGIHDKYFMLGLEPDEPIIGRAWATPVQGERRVAAAIQAEDITLAPGELRSYNFRLFTGPMVLSDMQDEKLRSADAVDFGFFGIIAIPILAFLKFLYGYIGSWGLSIIVLTVVIKGALFPLSQKSYKSMKAMQKLGPEIEKLKEKHGDDKEALNKDMMSVWKDNGVNPAGGCLPMLLQMPIWFALYRVLWNSVDLYQSEFLYFADLTMRDPLALFPILLGVTMFAQQRFTTTSATMDPVQQKMMQFMPLFFSLIMFTLPAGLVVYILINNILSIAQQWVIHRSNDDAPREGKKAKREGKAVAAGRPA
jgi:YidC/Oxa1 family membrane protein insertase